MMGGAIGMGAYGGPGSNDLGGQQDEPDDDTMMQELLEAAQAGDDAESDGMFSQVPGADGGEPKPDAASQITPEMLQQLMQMLQEKQSGDAAAPAGPGMAPGGM